MSKVNVSVEKVTLTWMNMIRARMEEFVQKDPDGLIAEFITPILEYGRAEEKRITEAFENE